MHEKEFSRTLVHQGRRRAHRRVSAWRARRSRARRARPPRRRAGYLPDPTAVDSWLSINADNTVTLKTSQIEIGNGISTGFLQVLAEELNMDMSQMHYGGFNKASLDVVDTYVAVSSGGEGGSNAMSGTGPKIRAARRDRLPGAARDGLDQAGRAGREPRGRQAASSPGGGKIVSYGELVGGQLLNAAPEPAPA